MRLIEPIEVVLDVRSHPTSKWEQFQGQNMACYLGERYEWLPELGGWAARHLDLEPETLAAIYGYGVPIDVYAKGKFPKGRIAKKIKADVNGRPSWTNVGLYDYSWVMTIHEFLAAADQLIVRSRRQDVAIMCAECLYYKCHRSMIADYVVWRGADATHLALKYRQKDKIKHVIGLNGTSHRMVLGNRIERYHPDILDVWEAWRSQHRL